MILIIKKEEDGDEGGQICLLTSKTLVIWKKSLDFREFGAPVKFVKRQSIKQYENALKRIEVFSRPTKVWTQLLREVDTLDPVLVLDPTKNWESPLLGQSGPGSIFHQGSPGDN